MNHGSLFSGIGGFDLAAEWMGWENIFHCEINEFGKNVLKYYWPNATSYSDIKTTDFTIHRGRIDILTGGFPCQPYSLAGKRKGKEDDRHLWPEMLRAVREIQPGWIVGENVFGLVNWSGGLVFDEVQTSLEVEGYEVFPFVLPACAVNAPHRRDRIWFVAYSRSAGTGESSNRCNQPRKLLSESGWQQNKQFDKPIGSIGFTANTDNSRTNNASGINANWQEENNGRERQPQPEYWQDGGDGITSNTCNKGLQGRKINGSIRSIRKERNEQLAGLLPSNFQNFPTQSPLCSRNDGLSGGLAGITFSKHRNESIKAYGNAIVPQVVYEIFKTIEQYNTGFLPSSCLADADNQ